MSTPSAAELIDEAADEVTDALRELVKGTHAAIVALQAQNETLKDKIEELEQEARRIAEEDGSAEATDALETVRYWLLDVLCHGKVPSDPRRLLRMVEEVCR